MRSTQVRQVLRKAISFALCTLKKVGLTSDEVNGSIQLELRKKNNTRAQFGSMANLGKTAKKPETCRFIDLGIAVYSIGLAQHSRRTSAQRDLPAYPQRRRT